MLDLPAAAGTPDGIALTVFSSSHSSHNSPTFDRLMFKNTATSVQHSVLHVSTSILEDACAYPHR
jgi:hypothetical protein